MGSGGGGESKTVTLSTAPLQCASDEPECSTDACNAPAVARVFWDVI